MKMKRFFTKLLLFGAPLTVRAFCLVTAKAKMACDDGSFTAYGFPLFWTMPGATSLSIFADFVAFIIDLTIYFAFFAVISATGLFDKFFARKAVLNSVLLWTAATLIGGFFLLCISREMDADKIYVDETCLQQRQSYAPHLGFPFSR